MCFVQIETNESDIFKKRTRSTFAKLEKARLEKLTDLDYFCSKVQNEYFVFYSSSRSVISNRTELGGL